MQKDKSLVLSRQLRWYGAAAAGTAALGTAPAAGAQVVYTDINPDVTLNAVPPEENETYAVDFDGDGDPELVLTEEAINAGSGGASDYIYAPSETALGPDQQIAVVGTIVVLNENDYQYFLPLSASQSISAGNVSTTAVPFFGPTFTFQGGDPNNWTDAGNNYAGIQFRLDNGDLHFGWILLEIPSRGTVIVKEFAYESTPGTAITAGDGGTVAIEPGPDGTPGTHALSAALPNPSNGRTQLALEVAQTQHVTVAVYNALGQQVALLHEGALAAGAAQSLTFDGSGLASGVYVVRVTGETFSDVRTLTLAR